MEHAVIDVGSNTIRLSIYDVNEDTHDIVQIYNKKLMAGLAGYVDADGNISKRGIDRAVDCIQSHQRKLSNYKVKSASAFATAVIRNAKNGEKARAAIEKRCGIKLTVLSGEDEARLGFFGAIHSVEATDGVLFDIGGGSTELVHFRKGKVVFAVSLPFGSLNMYLNHVEGIMPTREEQQEIYKQFDEAFTAYPELKEAKYDTIYGVGGSARAMQKLADDLFNEGEKTSQVKVGDIKRMLSLAQEPGNATLRNVLAVVPHRVHTCFPGMVCAYDIVEHCKAKKVVIANYGVREGYLFSHVLGERAE